MASEDQQILRNWLSAVAREDSDALRKLYDYSSPKLFGFALRILSKKEWAEEALQESFVSIWQHAGSYQASLAAPMTWMTTIVRNKCYDLLRRLDDTAELDSEIFDQEIMDAMESPEPGPLQALQLSGEARALAGCMGRLEALHRQAIALSFYHDLSHGEVAEQLKLPLGTVKTWIRRGLERLRTCLGSWEAV